MKRTLLLISVISLFAGLMIAQDDAAYKTAMKGVNSSRMPLRTAIMNKDVAAAAAEGKKMEDNFQVILDYWTAKKTDDAIKFATTARDAAKAIADAKDADAQSAASMQLNGVCNQCHMVHRGGMPPNFEIK